uniref:Uncharacterized protein n=1 Tax=Picea glauca TaxID=3330 RepID=A0A117NGF7_PICGL|nr:hypothetical protein ABT39_MTgene1413 [Picea glauca]QHR92398.1 hypothetical protein Q903MT_gene6441 [Picea sitchensis]
MYVGRMHLPSLALWASYNPTHLVNNSTFFESRSVALLRFVLGMHRFGTNHSRHPFFLPFFKLVGDQRLDAEEIATFTMCRVIEGL